MTNFQCVVREHSSGILNFLMMLSNKAETCSNVPVYNVSQIQLSLLNYILPKKDAKAFHSGQE
jgi:hypothetical protein